MFWTILTVLEVLWVAGITCFILLERRSPHATIAWLLGLSFLPVVGAVVYFFLGPRRLRRRRLRRARAHRTVAAAAATHAARAEREPAARQRVRQAMTLVETAAGTPPETAGSFRIHSDGASYYAAVEEAIAAARHHVHLAFYIFAEDRVGTRLRDLLARRAREGVEVRLLLDAVGSSRTGRRFLAPLREAGGEVGWFNRLTLSRLRSRMVNFRNHRKIVVCDGAVGFTGGMNVAEAHTAEFSGADAWRDTSVRVTGPVVRSLALVFLEDWQYATGAAPVRPPYLRHDLPGGKIQAQVAASGPDHDAYSIHKLYCSAIAAARSRALVTTPYFVPDDALNSALATAALRGVSVRVLLPARSDNFLVDAAARTFVEGLLPWGVEFFALEKPMVHAKTLVVDEDIAVVGSANMDNRSFRLNFEVAVVLYGDAPATVLAERFADDVSRAVRITHRSPAEVTFRRRLFESGARLFSPLL